MPNEWSALDIAHKMIKQMVKPGDFCIDATAGNGHDTEFLCSLVGESGRVIAMDIQQSAVDNTKARLAAAGFSRRAEVFLHEPQRHGQSRRAGKRRLHCL